ncbi:MAG: proline--tRNA ligase [Methanocellales archaeon]|nr:proline--tRNA ligase [Methanocellales archaeon]
MAKALPKKADFSEWYSEILSMAGIVDVRYPIKGLSVWHPFGLTLRNRVYSILRSLLDVDHQEALFPLLIPETEFMKEAEHIKGFEEEVYWVTKGGDTPLEVPLALRPTSETAIYPMFKLWIRSHTDLPLRVYQIVNTFRYETKHTRPLVRVREITSFKEAHTAHATWEDAEKQVHEAVRIYSDFYDRLAIPHIFTKRPDWDKFPGADYSIAVDTLMPDGKTLQIGTIHHLGTNFAKTFDVQYEDVNGEQQYVHQTCYGISERCVAAVIAIHGDDRGLILPPEVAPTQVVIVPILFGKGKGVYEAAKRVHKTLSNKGFRVVLDDSDERPGAKYYKWERKGVPLRIEVGPRDLKSNSVTLVRRDTFEKTSIPMSELVPTINQKLKDIHTNLYEKVKKSFDERIVECTTLNEVKTAVKKGIAKINWCGAEKCGLRMEEITGADVLGELTQTKKGKCPICEKQTDKVVLMARAY